jgi:phosphate/phosphite/phosphonate ABC transporter binding protein
MSKTTPRSSSKRVSAPDVVVLGYSAGDVNPLSSGEMSDFASFLGQLAMVTVALRPVGSYDSLAKLLHGGELSVAWLSPISFISLARTGTVVPLASVHRLAGHYYSAIIVPEKSKLRTPAGLRGKRAAWVDRHSAAGFVIPRIQLAAFGLNPKDAFGDERFCGTHEEVVQAVAKGDADFGATYARYDADGTVRGPWSHMPAVRDAVRVLTTFGEIPSDVIAAQKSVKPVTRSALSRALLGMTNHTKGSELVRAAFGADSFRGVEPKTYEILRNAVAAAVEDGILAAKPAAEVKRSDPDRTLKMPRRRGPRDSESTVELRRPSVHDDEPTIVDVAPDAPTLRKLPSR